MKIGIVIQGPLVTYGQGPNNSNGGFYSLETILENVERMSKFGFCYIVSTWVPLNIQEKEMINALENASIRIIQNLTPQIFDPDHRYKQHFGVLRGAEALLRMYGDVTHLVKIRTDMLMPEVFWEWAYVVSEKADKKLYVSELMNSPFYQGDFIYLADREVFLAFMTTVVNYKNRIIHPSIAFDMGIKNCETRNFVGVYGGGFFWRIYFLVDFIFRADVVRKHWNEFIGKYVGVMPVSIWVNIKWRERSIGSFLDSSLFKFDTLELTQNVKTLGNIITLIRDFRTYWVKCLKMWMK